ncbi:MAG TPA: 2OG-Fe(II) oxygenase [Candidatus Binatia bacterium]|nr:2OG-Fe(II) oxygenase [Candidatus Binatia bacterium]
MAESRSVLMPGDPAPWFRAPSNVNPDFDFASAAGRYIVLSFMGPADRPHAAEQLQGFLAEAPIFANLDNYFFGVVIGTKQTQGPFAERRSGMDVFWDADGAISRQFGALTQGDGDLAGFEPVTYILGLDLRVIAMTRPADPAEHARTTLDLLKRLPPLGAPQLGNRQAPVLYLPNVFEPALCRRLIEGYQQGGGRESGFMREHGGKTVLVVDHKHKRRSDWTIEDEALRDFLRQRIKRRIVPEIEKAFQFKVTRMERYIVACYDAEVGGYFQAHRDNTTKGTAHRRFAVTLNLNAEEYEGGELMFPEFGRTSYKPPTGGAVVFSCGLLHQALPVTRGKRYVFLPFLYDEAAAKQREAANAYLGDNVAAYQFGGER